jgi:hypothetical protein
MSTSHKVVLAGAAVLAVCAGALARQGDAGDDACQANLKALTVGISLYVSDYDEVFPPMKFPEQIRNRVIPYVRKPEVFSCPVTGAAYLPNPALNYRRWTSIVHPAETIALRDALPHRDGSGALFWNVAYWDLHVARSEREPALGKAAPTPPKSVEGQLRFRLNESRAIRRDYQQELAVLDAKVGRLRAELRVLEREGKRRVAHDKTRPSENCGGGGARRRGQSPG